MHIDKYLYDGAPAVSGGAADHNRRWGSRSRAINAIRVRTVIQARTSSRTVGRRRRRTAVLVRNDAIQCHTTWKGVGRRHRSTRWKSQRQIKRRWERLSPKELTIGAALSATQPIVGERGLLVSRGMDGDDMRQPQATSPFGEHFLRNEPEASRLVCPGQGRKVR